MNQESAEPGQGKQSRRSALKVFGAIGIAGTATLVGAKLRGLSAVARATVSKSAPRWLAGNRRGGVGPPM